VQFAVAAPGERPQVAAVSLAQCLEVRKIPAHRSNEAAGWIGRLRCGASRRACDREQQRERARVPGCAAAHHIVRFDPGTRFRANALIIYMTGVARWKHRRGASWARSYALGLFSPWCCRARAVAGEMAPAAAAMAVLADPSIWASRQSICERAAGRAS